jgi:hypothetical protein
MFSVQECASRKSPGAARIGSVRPPKWTLCVCLFISLWAGLVTARAAVAQTFTLTLAWDASPDAGVTGYRLYYGVASGQYTNSITVGNTTMATVTNLVKGVTYYFATTAYNASGVESPFSNEVTYTAPVTSRLHLVANAARQMVLTIEGQTGRAYNIEASENLTTWSPIGSVTPGSTGTASFVDTNAPSFSRRYYRLRDTSL